MTSPNGTPVPRSLRELRVRSREEENAWGLGCVDVLFPVTCELTRRNQPSLISLEVAKRNFINLFRSFKLSFRIRPVHINERFSFNLIFFIQDMFNFLQYIMHAGFLQSKASLVTPTALYKHTREPQSSNFQLPLPLFQTEAWPGRPGAKHFLWKWVRCIYMKINASQIYFYVKALAPTSLLPTLVFSTTAAVNYYF